MFNEVTFVDSESRHGGYEPLLGYVLLEQCRAAVDLVGHPLVPVKAFDLKVLYAIRDNRAETLRLAVIPVGVSRVTRHLC